MNMASFDQAFEYADYLCDVAQQNPGLIYKKSNSGNKGKSIHQKLEELYVEESSKQTDGKYFDKNLVKASHLLPKLVKKENLNCLVLKLYPGNEGYSLMLKGKNGSESETIKLPYDITEFLEYVDASELPVFLIDLLEQAQVNMFYSGCVILEVRDFRRCVGGNYETFYTLLKPTQLTMMSDIHNMCNDGHRWTQDDVNLLESQLLLATEEPICLDPSPAVLLVANKLQYHHKKMDSPLLKRNARKYSQAAVNRKRKFAQSPAPKELSLIGYLQKKKPKINPAVNLKIGSKVAVDTWIQKPVNLTAPESVDVEKFAKVLDAPDPSIENVMELVEEQTLERDISHDKKLLARLTINKRKLDDVFFGTLYLDHDYKENSKGKTCTFTLGTRLVTDKYLAQFREIFTEEGRRAVKITTHKPGLPPKVDYTHTSLTASAGLPGFGINRPSPAQNVGHSQVDFQLGTTGLLSATGKRNVPIQLSLTLAPGGSSSNTNQLQLNIQKPTVTSQSLPLNQRPKVLQQGQRSLSNTPDQSPASTPTSIGTIQFPVNVTTATSVHSVKTPIPAAVAPPNTTIPTSSNAARKPGADNLSIQQLQTGLQQGNITFVQAQGDTSSSQTGVSQPITNINIANIGFPPNILHSLNLQNMQVSLSMPGGIAVPFSLINTNSGVLQNTGGIFVTSIPGNTNVTTPSSSSSSSTGGTGTQVTSALNTTPSLVTMVNVTSSDNSTTATPSSTGVPTTGTASVIHAPAGMLSLPLGFVPNIKPQGGNSNIRASTSLPVLQIQGQQGIQIVGLQQQRAQLKAGATALPQGQQTLGAKTAPLTSTAVLMAPNIQGHPIKPGQTTGGPSTTIQPQQLMQLQTAQITFNKQQQQQLQQQQQQQSFTPIQLRPQTTTPTNVQLPGGKPKSKKRATPTPPK